MRALRLLDLSCGCFLPVSALLSAILFLPGEAATQEQPGEKGQPPAGERRPRPAAPSEMYVFQARHVPALELARMIQEIWGRGGPGFAPSLRVSADQRSNTLIVVADPEQTAMVKRLVSAIDVDRGESTKNEQRLEVIALKYIRADTNLEQELRMALSGLGSISVDYARNMVIVSGYDKAIQSARRLLDHLDRPQDKPPNPDMQVRIVWLVSGLSRKEAAKPPEDLKDVVSELTKLGVEDPRLASQTIVTAQVGKQFRIEGLAALDQPYRLSVNGTVLGGGTGETNRLQISVNAIQATVTPPNVANQVGRIETEITAPLGHSVVLGMTPTATSTSVFVVQILPKK